MRVFGLLLLLFAAAAHAPRRAAAPALCDDPTMQMACGAARRVSAGSCRACCGHSQAKLKAAGCTSGDIDTFCRPSAPDYPVYPAPANCTNTSTVQPGAYFSSGRQPISIFPVDTTNCSLDPGSDTACWKLCAANATAGGDDVSAWELFVNVSCKGGCPTRGWTCPDNKAVGLLPTDPPPLGSDVACAQYLTMWDHQRYGTYTMPPNRSLAPTAQARSVVGCTAAGIKYNASACCATYQCVDNRCVPAPVGLTGLPKYLCERDCHATLPPPPSKPNCTNTSTVQPGAYFSSGRQPISIFPVDTTNCSLDPGSDTACWKLCAANATAGGDDVSAWELFVNVSCKGGCPTRGWTCPDNKAVGLLPTDPPPLGSDVACAQYLTMWDHQRYGTYTMPPNRSLAPTAQARSVVGCTAAGIKYNASACCATYQCVDNRCVPAPVGLPKYLCEADCYPPPPPPPVRYDCATPANGTCVVQPDGFGHFNTSGECMASPTCFALPPPVPAGGWRPDWMTFYELDVETNGTGTQAFTNLVWDANLTLLEEVAGKFKVKAMWSFVADCTPGQQVFGEPYCGGPTGLFNDWKVGAAYTINQTVNRPWLTGLWLGDEPEILGVAYAAMCELILHLKQGLIKAGRGDVFLAYNDGPGSGQLSNGMCIGLDYFSIDNYADDPAQEVGGVKAAYAPLIAKLRRPNAMEPRGQGLWVVPGIFWGMASCTDRGGAGTSGTNGKAACSDPAWCSNGSQCDVSPSWLVEKMRLYWEWAMQEEAIKGINPWHWQDVPVLSPPSFSRGAVSLGPELKQWFEWIGNNITGSQWKGTADLTGVSVTADYAFTNERIPHKSDDVLLSVSVLLALVAVTAGLDNGVGRTPPMGTNDW